MTKFVRLSILAFTFVTCAASISIAQPFAGFTPGNLIVSRSAYAGDATIIAVGQAIPPVCPSTASCGTGKASDNGLYPSVSYTNNVWNNNTIDGSFGVTSPVYLDQITPAGTLVNTLAIPSSLVNTSFSSKSELALNLSADSSAITFMAYVVPANAIDVSNSNTPGVYDPTNPAGGSYYRAVIQVGSNGSIMVTPTNAYSGNNGRAAALANGYYYMVGNSNNGGGTPTNVINSTGAEIATPGQPASTPPTMIGNFSIVQVTNPATGQPYAADKAGKDNNFRGLTIFNNTMYVTKGSGGNGINTVYQVGNAGSLPTPATAASAPITVLPGFPVTLAKDTTTATYPFGIWFANSTTLYVGDEGDGVVADAASSKTAGLEKWVLTNGTWKMVYAMQNGLNLGQQYSITGYPTTLNPATDGIRNITGKVNGDGTVTIWGVTSTVSANGDQGADPNKLVSITDTLANTDPSVAANEKFTTVRSANWGEVLRGVSFAPTVSSTTSGTPLFSNVANPGATAIAPGSLAAADGSNIASGNPGPILGLFPTIFAGTSVSILDAAGKTTAAQLYYVSPNEIGYYVPTGVATGTAKVTVSSNGSSQTGSVQIANAAPGLFTINSSGLAAAYVLRVSGTTQTYESVFSLNNSGAIVAAPINMGAATDNVYLSLYGTGISGAGASGVQVTINGVNAPITFSGPQGLTPGLDQVNVQIPQSLAGKGNVNVQLTAGGVAANPVQITIQ
ncbi:MAG: hypothetical protein JO307_07100 [Bryobacterales bacterium]|nr:hypothetical protein [Bryobacterales bacterium]MBV9401266.1 hypothetical protein [Bryobacterales bacterium]